MEIIILSSSSIWVALCTYMYLHVSNTYIDKYNWNCLTCTYKVYMYWEQLDENNYMKMLDFTMLQACMLLGQAC